MNMTTRSFESHTQYPTPAPRPQDSRIVDTFYEQPTGPSEAHPSMQTEFFHRSLEKADQFPLHKQLLLGTWKKREVEEASFGNSPPRSGVVPNFHVRALSAPKRARNSKAFYEGRFMAATMERKYPDMVFLTPDMTSFPQVRAVSGGKGYVASSDAPASTTGPKTRDYDSTMMGSTVGGSATGKLTEADVLYKHKRQYAADFPMLADRFHPEYTATQRRMDKEREARVVRMKAEAEGAGGAAQESTLDPQCRFRPVALQQVTPVHPEYASGNAVSSTFAMCGQVSALPYDTNRRLRTAAASQRRRALGKEPSYSADTPADHKHTAPRSKTGMYEVTTYSSFASAAAPTTNSTKSRSFTGAGSADSSSSPAKSLYAPSTPSARPPLRIAVHPTRY